MAQVPAKLKRFFEEHIRVDEDDCWIWQGRVENGKPAMTINGNTVDVRVFAAEIYGITVPAEFETHSPLDVNPHHISAKKQNTGKYRKEDNEGMGRSESGRDTPDDGNGISQSKE